MVSRQRTETLPLRDSGPPRHSRDDHGLGHARQREFRMETRCSAAEGADPRAYIVSNLFLIQPVHLLPDRAVDRRITGVKPHRHFSLTLRFLHGTDHLVKSHVGTV